MAGSFVAWGPLGDGGTATVTQLVVAVPAGVQTGDRLWVVLNSSDSALAFSAGTLAAFTVLDGPRANGTSQGTAVLERILAASDGGTNLTIAWTGSAARVAGEWVIVRGTSGAAVVGVSQDTAATTTFVLPTIALPAGSFVMASTARRRTGAAANNTSTAGTPYTSFTPGTNNDYGTAFASGVNVYGSGGYLASSSGSSAGGETFVSGGVSSLGTNYVIGAPTGPQTGSGALSVTGSGSLALAASAPKASGALVRSGVGSLTLSGQVGGLLAHTGVGTLVLSGGSVGALARTGAGQLGLTGKLLARGALARTGAGQLVFTGEALAAGLLQVDGDGQLVLDGHRFVPEAAAYVYENGGWTKVDVSTWDEQHQMVLTEVIPS